jgi:phosphonate transport system substrate-binding protein
MNPTQSGKFQSVERRSLKRRAIETTVRTTIALGALLLLIALWNLLKPVPSAHALPAPPVLRIAVLPDVAPEQLRIQYTPLREYLSRTLSLPCELILPQSYQGMLDRFQAGEIDLALFGGYTFVLANRMNTAVPLVMSEADRNFTSVFITSSRHSGTNLSDYRGARFAFGSRLSTSGHVMPRIHLIERGIDPEAFFGSIDYTGAHDKTIQSVLTGESDIGAVNALILQSKIHTGLIASASLRILAETARFPDYVWVAQKKLPPSLRTNLRMAFLDLDFQDPEHSQILSNLDARAFFSAFPMDFETLTITLNSPHRAKLPDTFPDR